MALIPYTVTALEENEGTGKNIVAGAIVTMEDQNGNAVQMFDDDSGSGGSTSKVTGANGQVTIYVETGVYILSVNGSPFPVSIGQSLPVFASTTLELINGVNYTPKSGDSVPTLGYETVGDGGGAIWFYAGVTGLDSSRTPEQLGEPALTDKNGRKWALKSTGPVNVRSIGAINDGAAVDGLSCLANTKTIYFPTGTYLVNETLFNGNDDVTIYGDGPATNIRLNNDVNRSIFRFLNLSNPTVRDIKFTGVAALDPIYDAGNLREGLYFNNVSFPKVTGNTFTGFTSHCIDGEALVGGTFTEGFDISGNTFVDMTYDEATNQQSAILLRDDAEYSIIKRNFFYRTPKAFRCLAANIDFSDNIVMNSNGGQLTRNLNMPCFEYDGQVNAGKLIFTNNQFNHNDNQIQAVISQQSLAQNPCIIANNNFLANVIDNDPMEMLVVIDAPRSKIVNNNFRPSGSQDFPCLNIIDSDNCYVNGNDFLGGSYGIQITDSVDIRLGDGNYYSNQSSGRINYVSGSAIKNYNDQFNFEVLANGDEGATWGDDSWAVSNLSTGRYQFIHNMATLDYVCTPVIEGSNPNLLVSVEHGINSTNVYIKDISGTDTNSNFRASFQLSPNVEYGA